MEAHYGKNVAHVLVGDGAYLVLDDAGKMGKEEFYRYNAFNVLLFRLLIWMLS